VGEADFGAVDDAVSDGFDEGEDVVVGGVEEEAVEGGLCGVHGGRFMSWTLLLGCVG